MQPEAIVLSRSVPKPGRGAGHRAYRLLESIRAAGFATHLLALSDTPGTEDELAPLRDVCRWAHLYPRMPHALFRGVRSWLHNKSFSVSRYYQPAMARKLNELLPKASLVACIDALYFPTLMGNTGGRKPDAFFLLDLAEPYSQRLTSGAAARIGWSSWAMRSEARMVRKIESAAAKAADLTLLSNEVDLQIVAERVKTGRLWSVGNGAYVGESLSAPADGEQQDRLLFCGDLSQASHRRAAQWAATRLLPVLRRKRRSAQVVFFGRQLHPSVRRLARISGVQVLDPSVDGASLAVVMSQCVAGLAPQRIGRGAGDWVLPMLAMGRPVVSTAVVARMLPNESAAAPVIAESAREFADAAAELMANRDQARSRGAFSQRLVKEYATWDMQWRRLDIALQQLADGQRQKFQTDAPESRDLALLRERVRRKIHPLAAAS